MIKNVYLWTREISLTDFLFLVPQLKTISSWNFDICTFDVVHAITKLKEYQYQVSPFVVHKI